MFIRLTNYSAVGPTPINMRCPHCGHLGTFEGVSVADVAQDRYKTGQRRCPNLLCNGQIFIVYEQADIKETYPARRIDFDSTSIPDTVAAPFKEAITCHAEDCHVAAAIMIRRTLELLCSDRGAVGADLKTRIGALKDKVILPPALFEAMDQLRILGNDAAHVEARFYSEIGNEEIIVAIDLTKEILKAVYQMEGLVKKLAALKNKPVSTA